MHVVGARFADLRSAGSALAEIQSRVAVAGGDVAVRPLGSTCYEQPTTDFLLAGRFARHDVDTVVGIVERHGGELLSRRAESPHPSLTPPPRPAAASPTTHLEAHPAARRTLHAQAAAAAIRDRIRRLRRPGSLVRVRAARMRRSGA